MQESADITWLSEPEFKLISSSGNWDKFECVRAGSVYLNGFQIDFTVGWVTDVTSSPRWARSFLPQLGPHAPAALLHDRLLNLGYKRSIARHWMAKQLTLLPKVSRVARWRMVAGVWLYDQTFKLRYN